MGNTRRTATDNKAKGKFSYSPKNVSDILIMKKVICHEVKNQLNRTYCGSVFDNLWFGFYFPLICVIMKLNDDMSVTCKLHTAYDEAKTTELNSI